MTDSERIRTGIALSLFLHFMLLSTSWREDSPRADFSTTVQLDMETAAISPTSRSGLDVEAPSRGEAQEQARLADMKRRVFLRFLQDVDDAVHARRLDAGTTDLIGVAECRFMILDDGRFDDPVLSAGSGNPRLDAAALRAVRAASGTVPRPEILGTAPIPVTLRIKYQYGLR